MILVNTSGVFLALRPTLDVCKELDEILAQANSNFNIYSKYTVHLPKFGTGPASF